MAEGMKGRGDGGTRGKGVGEQGNTYVLCAPCASMVRIFAMNGFSADWGPRNIIVMISDGCGYNHVDAASIYQHGTTGAQVYHQFPIQFGMSTYMAGGSYDPARAWSLFLCYPGR